MITVRQINDSEIDAVHKIEQESFSQPWTKQMMLDANNAEKSVILAAKEDNVILGYATAHYVLDEGYLDNLAVKAGCMSNGVGTKIMQSLIDWCKEHSLAFLTLEVRQSNTAARHLYEKMGMKQVGYRKNFYSKPQEDAVLMTVYFE